MVDDLPLPDAIKDQLVCLNDELRQIRTIFDEIRTDLQWAIQNGRVVLSVVDSEDLQSSVDASIDTKPITLVIQLTDALRALRFDVSQALKRSRQPDLREVATGTVSEQVGAEEEVIPQLELHQTVRFESEGEEYVGEIYSIDEEQEEAIVSLPELSDFVHVPLDMLTVVTNARVAAHQQWIKEVCEPAQNHSEGVRRIEATKNSASINYEIAPLPTGEWAIHWDYGFHCGDHTSHSSPWKLFSSREECLNALLKVTREFFSRQRTDQRQNEAAQEIIDQIQPGLFGFKEPEAIKETEE